jgi:IMP dehydrogenase/GMP reductase
LTTSCFFPAEARSAHPTSASNRGSRPTSCCVHPSSPRRVSLRLTIVWLQPSRAGGIGIILLFGSVEDQAYEVRKVKELMCKDDKAACDLKGRPVVGAPVNLERDSVLEWIGLLAEVWTDIIVVDVPHADRLTIPREIQAVKAEHDWLSLMDGNVQTRAGAKDVIDAGADIVVGSGFSSFAEATELSGVGVPELSALIEVEDVASSYGRPIICNMGVRSAASVVKALAAGAAAVVLNTLTPDTTTSRVMAHVATQVRESLSYVGARSIAELREKAEFIQIRPPSAV